MKKIVGIIASALLFTSLVSEASSRRATADIPLTNGYYYRLAERAMSINPSEFYTDNVKPVSAREAEVLFNNSSEMQELFGRDQSTAYLSDKAMKYYNVDNLDTRGFDIEPLTHVSFKARFISEEGMQSTNDFGEPMGDDLFARVSLGGSIYFGKNLSADYTFGVYNNSEETKLEVERAKIKLAGKHNAYIGAIDNIQLGPGYFGQLMIGSNISPQKFAMIKSEIPYNWGFLGKFRFYIFNFWFDDEDRDNKDPMLLGLRLSLKPTSWLEMSLSRSSFYGGSNMPSYSLDDYWDLVTAKEENSNSDWDSDQFVGADLSVYLPFLKKTGFLQGGKFYIEYNWNDLRAPWQDEDEGRNFKLLGSSYIYGLFFTTGKTDFRFEYVSVSALTYLQHNYAPEGYSVEGYIAGHQIGRDNKGIFFEIYTELNDRIHPYFKASFIEKNKSALNNNKQKEQQYTLGAEMFFGKNIEADGFVRLIKQDKEDLDDRIFYYNFSGDSEENYIVGMDLKYYF
jgi:hypothetical protein